MPKGWPDFTLPISIEAVAIATLPVDIKAQTVGNLNVNIAAQASAFLLKVDVVTGVLETATAGVFTNTGWEAGFNAWGYMGNVTIDETIRHTGLRSCRLESGMGMQVYQGPINPPISTNVVTSMHVWTRFTDIWAGIKAVVRYSDESTTETQMYPSATDTWEKKTINYVADKYIKSIWFMVGPGGEGYVWVDDFTLARSAEATTSITSSVQLNINIAASAVALDVAIISSAVTLDVSIVSQGEFNLNVNLAASAATVNVNITGSVTLNVNVTNATITVTGSVSISGTVTVQGTVSISGTVTVAGTVSVSGTVTVEGSVSVSGTVSISGTVTITGTVNVSGTVTITGAVTITSGTVNVQTSGATNIIIDKLTQTAYLERRAVVYNDNGVSSPNAPPSFIETAYRGKFFPRGCRGVIDALSVYCKQLVGGETITLCCAPHPGMGAVFSVMITPETTWNWKGGGIHKMWNYDSIFIWVSAMGANVDYGYDTGTPYDAWNSTDSGATWGYESRRYFLRVDLPGETVGDVPVSGTINAIPIPTVGSMTDSGAVNVPASTETNLVAITGAGTCDLIIFWVSAATNAHLVHCKVYCDGTLSFDEYFDLLNTWGFTASTPKVSLVKYTGDGLCVLAVSKIFEFTRQLRVAALTGPDYAISCRARVHPNLIK